MDESNESLQIRRDPKEFGVDVDVQTEMLKRDVSLSISRAGEEASGFVIYFTPRKGQEKRSEARMQTARNVANLLSEDSEQAIRRFVEVLAYPMVDIDFSEGKDIRQMRVDAAREVADKIENAAEKFKDKPDAVFYPKFEQASSEKDRNVKAVMLAGTMAASMQMGEYGDKGADKARWHLEKRPSDMPIRYGTYDSCGLW
jgi:hypothetical protein